MSWNKWLKPRGSRYDLLILLAGPNKPGHVIPRWLCVEPALRHVRKAYQHRSSGNDAEVFKEMLTMLLVTYHPFGRRLLYGVSIMCTSTDIVSLELRYTAWHSVKSTVFFEKRGYRFCLIMDLPKLVEVIKLPKTTAFTLSNILPLSTTRSFDTGGGGHALLWVGQVSCIQAWRRFHHH